MRQWSHHHYSKGLTSHPSCHLNLHYQLLHLQAWAVQLVPTCLRSIICARACMVPMPQCLAQIFIVMVLFFHPQLNPQCWLCPSSSMRGIGVGILQSFMWHFWAGAIFGSSAMSVLQFSILTGHVGIVLGSDEGDYLPWYYYCMACPTGCIRKAINYFFSLLKS